jgi:hypothetical protein
MALGVLGLAATGCADQSAAARVGDQTLSEEQLLAEATALADDPELTAQAEESGGSLRGASEASISQDVAGFLLNGHVQAMLFGELFAREGQGLVVDDTARANGEQQYESFYGGLGEILPDSFRSDAVEGFAKAVLVQEQLGSDFNAAFNDVVETTEVHISSRYGTWDAEAFLSLISGAGSESSGPSIVPPAGPLVVDGDGSDTSDDAQG